ncbi:CYTH domain-containing protein [Reyranella sp.]|uniref:CYTH domain-containing protein n=1 Tax=Reyranella sp. TaxID=1929291 RepID=UPI003D09F010
MATEIERKFLVANDAWRKRYVRKDHIKDGLVCFSAERKVRVRLRENRATLTIKGKKAGFRDYEFEYEIPVADAKELLASHCDGYVLEKTRYHVPHGSLVWEVDVYEGILDGIVLAEIEVSSETAPIPLPDWIGAEVTGRPEYKKINLQRARWANAKSVVAQPAPADRNHPVEG